MFLALASAGVTGMAWDTLLAQAPPADLSALTIGQAADRLRSRAVSPVELTRACLQRIETYNPQLNAYITVTAEQALADAAVMEAELRRGRPRSPLHGIPIALKDNIDTAGVRTTGASDLFRDRVPAADAEVTRRLKQAGIILLGKLNLHEFAYGGTSTVTAYGTMHNPWALDRITGGSSGGPGVAVAAGLCYGSIGTDTAGSIRMPAAHCGIVGLKPTYGRVPSRGVMTLSWTLDHIGPMCRSVEDAAIMMNAIAGYDTLDPTTVNVPVEDYTRALRAPTRRLRLGVLRGPFATNLDPEVDAAFTEALRVLKTLTASTVDATLPPSGNPSRLWGPEAYVYHEPYITTSPEKYQPGTRASVQNGANVKASEYIAARHEVELARRTIGTLFRDIDLLVAPTMKQPPMAIGAPGAAGGGGNNNATFDIFGLPAISVPCGFTRTGLPIGLTIAGNHWAESTVLALAHAYERATTWHTRRPPLTDPAPRR